VDTGGDGTLSESEIRIMFQKMGRKVEDSQVRTLMRMVDDDGNGYITWKEYVIPSICLVLYSSVS
jgi:Ca2+-binding EF-hand superfamily protein